MLIVPPESITMPSPAFAGVSLSCLVMTADETSSSVSEEVR